MSTQAAARTTAPKASPKPNAKSDRRQKAARAGLERMLRCQFEDFMRDGTLGEKWFLWDVFVNHQGEHRSFHENSCELGIVSAFEQSVSEGVRNHFCIEDEKLFGAVQRFIADYYDCQETGGNFEAQPDGWRLWKNRKAAS